MNFCVFRAQHSLSLRVSRSVSKKIRLLDKENMVTRLFGGGLEFFHF